jgi:hypothetical protein
MATRLKTVQYAFATLAALTNNTLTNLTQRTIFLPETGTKTFRSVVAHVTFNDIITGTGGSLTTKTLSLRLGAAAYTTVANANTLTNSGENQSFHLVADFTSHFTANWTGTSMTCDFQLQINQSTGTTLGMVNVCVTLEITYEYDDTSTTQVKSVMIPLNAPVGALATSATTVDTFPALDTYLPEASKTYRDIFVVVQGNEHRNAATTDHTMTISVGSTTVTTGNYEGALASDRWFRYVFDILAAGFAGQASSQNFQLSATVARCNHLQAYAVVTYEYNESTSTSIMNSVMLPMKVNSPAGGTTSSDYQRTSRWLDIEEPATITTSRVAFYPHWQQIAAIGGLNMRIGTGAFVAYTDTASVLCGGNGAMVRNDSAFTLVRGRNTLNFDVYRTDTADFMWNISGFWLVNYSSGKHSAGSGSHNHSVLWSLLANGTAAGADNYNVAAVAPVIPEAEFYITALGSQLVVQPSGATQPAGMVVNVERLAGESGIAWEEAYRDIGQTDAELGVYFAYSQTRDIFKRWANDADSGRIDLETARRWRVFLPGGSAAAPGWVGLSVMMTYHSILSSVAGNITNSAGGTVNLNLHDSSTGEVLKTGSRTGNGAYSISFFGNTRSVYVTARESGTLLGRSDTGTPTLA